MQECFNTRQFDQADDLFTPDFMSHPLGTTGFESVKSVWRKLAGRFPHAPGRRGHPGSRR
jgi:hypothetical protein